QPERHLHRGPAAPLVLPARAQARASPARPRRGGHQRRPALLPRHRQRAPCGAPEGACGRMRGLLYRAPCARALCERLRGAGAPRSLRGVRQLPWRRLLRPAAQRGAGGAGTRGLGPAGVPAVRGRCHRAARRRRAAALAAASPGRGCRRTASIRVIRIDVEAFDRGLAAAPWGGPIHAAWRGLLPACPPEGVPLTALDRLARERSLRTGAGRALRFVAADTVEPAAYEAHIARTGEVPTRVA